MARWRAETAEERFWRKVNKTDDCWLWTGSLDRTGYGEFVVVGTRKGRRKTGAHRFAWELDNGPIADGMELDHLCRVHSCVRPSHMELVTHRENVLRGESPSARQARWTHCINGHEFTERNTRITPAGRRKCRACHRANERRRTESRSR